MSSPTEHSAATASDATDETSRDPDDSAQAVTLTDRYRFVTLADSDLLLPSLDGLGDPVIAIDQQGNLRYANDRAVDRFGWSRRELLGTPVIDLVHPDDLNLVLSSMQTVMAKPFGDLIRIRARHGRGGWVHIELRGAVQHLDAEELIVLVARDVTDRHLLDFDQGDVGVLRSVMNNMHAMVALVDADGKLRSVNGAVTRLLGHDPERVRGTMFPSYFHEDDRAQVLDLVQTVAPDASVTFDARLRGSDGAYHVCDFTVNNLVDDPVVRGHIVTAQIASSLVDARRRVDFLADHDMRTGLLNRDGFMKAARQLMSEGGGLGIMVVDVRQFRSINELYGEPTGDAVLAAVAERIDQIRWPDLVTARFGGDEFVLAVRSANASTIDMLRERVRRDVPQTIEVHGQEVTFNVRTATAFESRPQALDSLLVTASNELMALKRRAEPESSGITFDAIAARRVQLDQLRAALTNGEIQPFFQPIVDADGLVTAVEALVRWVHPIRGVLGVGEILPLAQMAGLAEAVDDRVLELALQFARRLELSGHGHVEVHVNVDPKVIASPSFGHTFLDRCVHAEANPAQMVVEITETDLLAPGAVSLSNMQKLRRAGTHVSIDDFGTGYSSLSHLLELPVDGVKIDRRFVAGIDIDPAATNLTAAILGLSDSLGLTCVAEGVEQPYQRDRLAERGCTAFQGWLFSPAVHADEVITMLPRITPAATAATAPASSTVFAPPTGAPVR